MASQHRILKGTPWLADFTTPLKLASLGNTAKITLTTEVDEKSVADNENSGGGNAEVLYRPKAPKISIELKKVSAANLAFAMGGTLTPIAAGAVVDEEHTAYVGCFIPLNKPQDKSVALTVKVGAVAKNAGVDFVRRNGGIYIPAGSSIIDGDTVKISYTAKAGNRLEALVNTTKEFRIVIEDFDEVSDDLVLPDFYRVRFSPAKSIDFIGDDFVSLVVEGTLLNDDSKSGVGISKMTNVLLGF